MFALPLLFGLAAILAVATMAKGAAGPPLVNLPEIKILGPAGGVEEHRLVNAPIGELKELLVHFIGLNEAYLATHPGIPVLYRARVRYKEEPLGQEVWQTTPVLYESGVGDCEDCTGARVAELRAAGQHADFALISGGEGVMHILVVRDGGIAEDPSARLGMDIAPFKSVESFEAALTHALPRLQIGGAAAAELHPMLLSWIRNRRAAVRARRGRR